MPAGPPAWPPMPVWSAPPPPPPPPPLTKLASPAPVGVEVGPPAAPTPGAIQDIFKTPKRPPKEAAPGWTTTSCLMIPPSPDVPPPPDVGSFPHYRTRLPLQRHHGGGRGINMTQIMTIMTRWRGGTNVLQVYTYLFIYFLLDLKKLLLFLNIIYISYILLHCRFLVTN